MQRRRILALALLVLGLIIPIADAVLPPSCTKRTENGGTSTYCTSAIDLPGGVDTIIVVGCLASGTFLLGQTFPPKLDQVR